MAQDVERVRVACVPGGQDLNLLTVGERQTQVPDRAVRPYQHRLLGELRPDRARSLEP